MAINRDINLNKVNRNFNMQVRLYFNSASHNREIDAKPRYFLEPSKLNYVERVAFSEKGAKEEEYLRVSRRMYAGKHEIFLSDIQIEAIFDKIKGAYPYGYTEDNVASTNKYLLDFKYNQAYQSHLNSYWLAHQEEIVRPKADGFGIWSSNYPYESMPFIEVEVDEIIKYKYAEGDVPVLTDTDGWIEHEGLNAEILIPMVMCSPTEIDLSIGTYEGRNVFLQGDIEAPIFVVDSGETYKFSMVYPWTGTPDGTLVNWPLKFSTGYDGTLVEGIEEYTEGVTYEGVHGDKDSSVSIAITENTPTQLFYYGPSGDMGAYLIVDSNCTY